MKIRNDLSYKHICDFVVGEGLGICRSSLAQIEAELWPSQPMGQAKVECAVNLIEKNIYIKDRSLKFEESSGPLELYYRYNSKAANSASAWSLSIKKLNFIDPNKIMLIEEDGHETTYEKDQSSNIFRPKAFGNGTPHMHNNTDLKCWEIYHPDKEIFEQYDYNGLLIRRIDRQNHSISFEYKDQQLFNIVSSAGENYEIFRQKNLQGGELISIYKTISENKITSAEKDKLLKQHTSKLANGKFKSLLQEYAFDNLKRLRESRSPNNYKINYEYQDDTSATIKRISQTDNSELVFGYDGGGKLPWDLKTVSNTDPDLDSKAVNATTRKFSIVKPSPGEPDIYVVNDNFGYNHKFIVDNNKKKLKKYICPHDYQKEPKEVDEFNFAYHDNGQIKTILYPNSKSDEFQYDEKEFCGLKSYEKKTDGKETKFYYTHSLYPSLISKGVRIGKDFSYTHYVHEDDQLNSHLTKLRFEVSPEGRVKQYIYDATFVRLIKEYKNARYTKTINPDSQFSLNDLENWSSNKTLTINLTQLDHNIRGQLIFRQKFIDTNHEVKPDEKNDSKEHFLWDFFGNLENQTIKQDYQKVQKEQFTFDDLNRTTSFTNADNKATNYKYQDNENQVIKKLPNGRIEVTTFNTISNPISVKITATNAEGLLETRIINYNIPPAPKCIIVQETDESKSYEIKSYLFYNYEGDLDYEVSPTGLVTQYIHNHKKDYKQTIHYAKEINMEEFLKKFKQPSEFILSKMLDEIRDDKKDHNTYEIYDPNGKIQFAIDEEGYLVENLFDSARRDTGKVIYNAPLSPNQINGFIDNRREQPINITQDRFTQKFYDNDDKLKGEVDAAGYLIEYIRDGANFITQKNIYFVPVTDRGRNSTFEEIKANSGTKTATTYYFGNGKNEIEYEIDAEGYITKYEYYANSLLKSARRFSSKEFEFKNKSLRPALPKESPDDETIEYTYDILNRKTAIKYSNGKVEKFAYDVMDQITLSEISEDGIKDLNPDNIRQTRTKYNGFGEAVARANPFIAFKMLFATDPEIKKLWENDSNREEYKTGLVVKSINSLSKETIYYYDQEKRPIISINPTGLITQISYDTFSNKQEIRRYKNPIPIDKLKALSGGFNIEEIKEYLVKTDNDQVDKFQYDKRGFKKNHTDPMNNISEFETNAFKQTSKEILPIADSSNKMQIDHQYDTRGNEIATIKQAGNTTITTSKEFNSPFNVLTGEINPYNKQMSYDQDLLGRRIAIINYLGNKTIIENNAFRAFKVIDELFRVHESIYNQNTRTEITSLYQLPPQLKSENKIESKSDSKLHEEPIKTLLSTEQKNIFDQVILSKDALDNETKTTHEPDGQVRTITNPLQAANTTEHDSEGQVTCTTDTGNLKTSLERDDAGNVNKQTEQKVLPTIATEAKPRAANSTVMPDVSLLPSRSEEMAGQTNNLPSGALLCKGNQKRTEITELNDKLVDDFVHVKHPSDITQGYVKIDKDCKEIKKSAQNGPAYVTNFKNDSFGRAEEKTDPLQTVTSNGYDKNDNKLSSQVAIKQDNAVLETDTSFNAANQSLTLAIEQKDEKEAKLKDLKQTNKRTDRDLFGRVTGQTMDPKGLQLSRSQKLNKNDFITSETDEENNTTFYIRDAQNQIRFVVDPRRGILEKIYDNNGQLIQTITYTKSLKSGFNINDDSTPEEVKANVEPTSSDTNTLYFYGLQKNQERFRLDIIQENGKTLAIVHETKYDAAFRPISTTDYTAKIEASNLALFTTSYLENLKKDTPTKDRTEHKILDAIDQVRFVIDPKGYVTEFLYNNDEQIIQKIIYATQLTDEQIKKIIALPDTKVRAELTIVKDKDITEYNIYDDLKHLEYTVDGRCGVIGYNPNYNGDVESECHYNDPILLFTDYDDLCNKVRKKYQPDPKLGRLTTTKYDEARRKRQTTNPLSISKILTPDVLGNVSEEKDEAQKIWQSVFDKASRLTGTRTPVITVPESKPSIVTAKEYYKTGKIKTMTEAKGLPEERTLAYEYDASGHLILAKILNSGKEFKGQLKNVDGITVYQASYNAKNKKLAEQNKEGEWTYYIYDEQNRVIFSVNSVGAITQHVRDTFGDEVETKQYNKSITIKDDYKTTGIPVDNVMAVITDAKYNKSNQVYDTRGDLTRKEVLNGNKIIAADVIEYNPLRKPVCNKKLIKDDIYSSKFTFYDKTSKTIAEIDEQKFVKGMERNIHSEIEKETNFINALTVDPDANWSEAQLAQYLADIKNEKDRIKKTNFDPCGLVKDEIEIGLITQEAVEIPPKEQKTNCEIKSSQPVMPDASANEHSGNQRTSQPVIRALTFQNKPAQDATTSYQYNNVQDKTKTILPNQAELFHYYDERHALIGETGIPRLVIDKEGKEVKVTPFIAYTVNGLSQVEEKREFKTGLLTPPTENYPDIKKSNDDYVVKTERDKLDHVIKEINDNNNLMLKSERKSNQKDLPLWEMDANKNKWRLFYDAQNQERFKIGPEGEIYEQEWDYFGNVATIRVYDQKIDLSKIDDTTKLEKIIELAQKSNSDTVTYQIFDQNKNLRYAIKQIDQPTAQDSKSEPGFKVSIIGYQYNGQDKTTAMTEYNALLNLNEIQNKDANELDVLMNDKIDPQNDRTNHYIRNARGEPCINIGPEGAIIEQEFDVDGNMIKQTSYANRAIEYNLAPMSNGKLKKNIIEYKCEANGLRYRVIGLDNQEKIGLITWADLPNDFPRNQNAILENKEKLLAQILIATSKLGHTRAFDRKQFASLSLAQAKTFLKTLANPDHDRTIYHVYNYKLKKIEYEVDVMCGVKRYAYNISKQCLGKTLYDQKIEEPKDYNDCLAKLQALKPNPDRDQTFVNTLDEAGQIREEISPNPDYKDAYQYDIFGNQVTHTNKKGSKFVYGFDSAKRQTTTISPSILATQVKFDDRGKLTFTQQNLQSIEEKKLDGIGNIIRLIKAKDSADQREIESSYTPSCQLKGTMINNVNIDDPKKFASEDFRQKPETKPLTITTNKFYNAKHQLVSEQSANNVWKFYIYDSCNVEPIYEISQVNFDQVPAKGFVIETQYNPFGNPSRQIKYSVEIAIPAEYKEKGIPRSYVESVLNKNDPEKREVLLEHNRLGKVTSEISSEIYCADFAEEKENDNEVDKRKTFKNTPNKLSAIQKIKPEVKHDYNTFGDEISCTTRVGSIRSKTESSYYDKKGRKFATVTPERYLKRTTFDRFDNEEQAFLPELPLIMRPAPDATPLQINNLVIPNPFDLTIVNQFDRQNNKTQYTLKNVRYYKPNYENNPPTYELVAGDVTLTYTYTPTGKIESIADEENDLQFFYYNACDDRIAQVDVPRALQIGTPDIGIPITKIGVNLHGQIVALKRYKNNAKPIAKQLDSKTEIKSKLTLKQPNIEVERNGDLSQGSDTKDQLSLTLFDNRGLTSIKQDPEEKMTGTTVTPDGQVARTWCLNISYAKSQTKESKDNTIVRTIYNYDLVLMSKNSLKNNIIEFKCETKGIRYRVIGLDNQEKESLIPWDLLPNDFPKKEKEILANKDQLLLKILEMTSKVGHTLIKTINLIRKTNIDEKVTELDNHKRTIGNTLRRDQQNVATRVVQLNSHSEPIAEGPGNNEWPVQISRDLGGFVWKHNQNNGAYVIQIPDLTDHAVLQANSGNKDLKDVPYDSLPSVPIDKEISITSTKHNLEGHVINVTSPDLYQPSNTKSMPLQMSVGNSSFGNLSLCWTLPPVGNIVGTMSFRRKGTNDPFKEFKNVKTTGNRSGIDLSELQTIIPDLSPDIYEYKIDYYRCNPVTKEKIDPKNIAYRSLGAFACELGDAKNSRNVIISSIKDGKVRLVGNVLNLKSVYIPQTKQTRNVVIEQGACYVDCSDLESGIYTFQPETQSSQLLETLPFVLYTNKQIPSRNPLSQEFKYAAQISVDEHATDAVLKHTIDRYQQNPLLVSCKYTTVNGQQLETKAETLSYDASKQGYVLTFDQPIKTIDALSLKLVIDNNFYITLYDKAPPVIPTLHQASYRAKLNKHKLAKEQKHEMQLTEAFEIVTPHEADEEDDYQIIEVLKDKKNELVAYSEEPLLTIFPEHSFIEIKPFVSEFKELPKVEFFDVSQASEAQWKSIAVNGYTQHGFIIDVSGFELGNYPYRILQDDATLNEKRMFFISNNQFVFAGENHTGEEILVVSHAFLPDRNGNIIAEINSLNERTDTEYSNNRPIRILQPAIQCMLDNDAIVTQRAVTQIVFNKKGTNLGTVDARDNFFGNRVNQAGQPLMALLGDGTITRKSRWNNLTQEEFYLDAEEIKWTMEYNKNNKLMVLIRPDGIREINERNDQGEIISRLVDKAMTFFGIDPFNNTSLVWNPDNTWIEQLFHPSGNPLGKVFSDGGSIAWLRDYFGVASSFTNLDKEKFVYEHDFNRNLKNQKSSGGPVRDFYDYRIMRQQFYTLNEYGEQVLRTVDICEPYKLPLPNQDLIFVNVHGRVAQIIDSANQKIILYQYDTEGRKRILEIRRFDGSLIYRSTSGFDAMGNQVLDADAMLTLQTLPDLVRNKRLTTGMLVNPDSGVQQSFKLLNIADRANRMTTYGKRLDIPDDIGLQREFKNNKLRKEARIENKVIITTSFLYSTTSLLTGTNTEQSDGKNYGTFRFYNSNFKIEEFHTFGNQQPTVIRKSTFKGFGAGPEETCTVTESGVFKMRKEIRVWLGENPTFQVLKYEDKELPSNYDEISIDYAGHEDRLPSHIKIMRRIDTGQKVVWQEGHTYLRNDSNGTQNSVEGSDSDVQPDSPPTLIIFDTAPNGTELKKTTVPMNEKVKYAAVTFLVHNPDGQVLGSFGYVTDPNKTISKEDIFGLTKMAISGEHFALNQRRNRFYQVPGRPFVTGAPLVNKQGRGLALNDTIAPLTDVTSAPTVFNPTRDGQTCRDIATVAGSSSDTSLIATTNNLGQDEKVRRGTPINIPELIPVMSRVGEYGAYATVKEKLIGKLTPHLDQLQLDDEEDFMGFVKQLAKVVVVGLAVMYAPGLAHIAMGALGLGAAGAATAGAVGASAAVGTSIVSDIALGVSAAFLDSVGQGALMGLGLQSKFSATEALEVGLGQGIYSGTATALGEGFVSAGVANATTQLLSMKLGKLHKFDVRSVLVSMGAATIGAKIAGVLNKNQTERIVAAGTEAITTSILTAAVYHRTPFMTDILSQAIGAAALRGATEFATAADKQAPEQTRHQERIKESPIHRTEAQRSRPPTQPVAKLSAQDQQFVDSIQVPSVPKVTKLQTVASGKTYNQLQAEYNPPVQSTTSQTNKASMEAKHPENTTSAARWSRARVGAQEPSQLLQNSQKQSFFGVVKEKLKENITAVEEWYSTKYAPLLVESNPLVQLEKQMLKVAVNDMLPQGASVQDRVELLGDVAGLAPIPIAKLGVVAKFGLAKLGVFGGTIKEFTKVGEKVSEVIKKAKTVTNTVQKQPIGLTTRLNRTQIKNYLANVHDIERDKLINDLESVGLEFKGGSKDGRFMEFVDKSSNTRVKIHPPDNVGTNYNHIHIYDKEANSLNAKLERVPYKSPEAHIQIKSITQPSISNKEGL